MTLKNIIQPTMAIPASQYLARLMRPSKLNRCPIQSMTISGRRGSRSGYWSRLRVCRFELGVTSYFQEEGAHVRCFGSRESIPQQLVDAGLGAGSLVDALDDDGAGG